MRPVSSLPPFHTVSQVMRLLQRGRSTGADAYLVDREKRGTELPVRTVDVTNLVGLRAEMGRVLQDLSGAVVVVNFAGVHHPAMDLTKELTAGELETFRRVIDVNLMGPFVAGGQSCGLRIARKARSALVVDATVSGGGGIVTRRGLGHCQDVF